MYTNEEKLIKYVIGGSVIGVFICLLALISLNVLVTEDHIVTEHEAHLDRLMAVEQLQNYSDYIGFEAQFSLDVNNDRILIMTGTPLCGNDFPSLIPPNMWKLIPSAGFRRLVCSYENTQTILDVP